MSDVRAVQTNTSSTGMAGFAALMDMDQGTSENEG